MKKKQGAHPADVEQQFDADKGIVVGMFEKLVDDTFTKGKLGHFRRRPHHQWLMNTKTRMLAPPAIS